MESQPKQVDESYPLAIHCDRHGVTAYCLICQHLRTGEGIGFWEIEAEDDEPGQAWCELCDAALDQDQGWSDRAEALADWKLYCGCCYSEALERHQRLGWDSGGPPLQDE